MNWLSAVSPQGDYEIENTEGSVGHVPFSDDEDFISSGSGSGMYSGMSSENGDIIIDSECINMCF